MKDLIPTPFFVGSMMYDAKRFMVCSGTGTSTVSQINAFDAALKDAGVEDVNLIKVSSVLPEGIVEVEYTGIEIGAFRTCVLARADGYGEQLLAGLSYGFRGDGKGGYVAENAVSGDTLSKRAFENLLEKELTAMSELRDVRLRDTKTVISELNMDEDAYGCAVVVLVYLP